MSELTVGAAANVERLRERVFHGVRELERQGYLVSQREHCRGGYTFLSVAVRGGSREVLRRQLAAVLCEVILCDFRDVLLDRIVSARYPQLGGEERAAVVQGAQRLLRERLGSAAARETVKTGVLVRLLEYLEANDELVVEGFITFRLKDYVDQLEEAVEGAVEELLLEREYEEFVRLLQCFVASQPPKVAEAHVFCHPRGLALEDSLGWQISPHFPGSIESALRPEDLIVSGLVGLAPRWITVHGSPGSEDDESLLRTIYRIFGDRVRKCPGCPRCQPPGF